MRRFTHVSLILAALMACLMPGDNLWAKNGRAGFKGGGGKSFKGSAGLRGNGSSKSGAGPKLRSTHKPSFADRHTTKHILNDSEQPWTKHQARELRKLEHRKQVADHLREISDRNGNEHLKQVADDMDERAQAHYDKQLEKIREKYGLDDTDAEAPENPADNPPSDADESHDDSGEHLNGANDNVDEAAGKLTGTENAAARQLRNEQRKLAKRMEAVEKLRAMADETGDESMLQAADQLEQEALEHFHQRMTKITEFRQRHGLPDVTPHIAP